MIQVGTTLNILDNSGVSTAYCIRLNKGFKKRYAGVGDIVLVVIKQMRSSQQTFSKVKQGQILYALIVQTKHKHFTSASLNFKFASNAAVLITREHKLVGNRVLGVLPISFRYTRCMRVLALASIFC